MITRRRLAITVLLAVALGGFYYAFTRPTDPGQPQIKDEAVVFVEPAPGELVLRQAEIAIELKADYTGFLTKIDERIVPEDENDRTLTGNTRIAFTPADGKAIEALEPGRRCAEAEFWLVTQTRDQSRQYSWCFQVH